MKQIITTFFALLMAVCLWAQAPQAFNYQAVVRDAGGNLLENQAVGIKISLLQGSATGLEVYAETHTTTTNQFGQVDLKIGTGTVLTGQFDTIPWNTGNYHLQLSVDLSGGANYQIMGTTQMLSVPYALYAEEGSGWEKTENGISYKNGNVQIGDYLYDAELSVQGNIYVNDTSFIEANDQNAIRNQMRFYLNDTIRSYGYSKGIDIKAILNENVTIGSAANNRYFGATFSSSNVYGKIYGSCYGLYGNSYLLSNGTIVGNSFGVVGSNSNLGHITGDMIGIYGYVDQVSGLVEGKRWAGKFAGNTYITGNLGIQTDNPTYPLTVNGTIRSKKVIVDTGWSDFVFEDDYSLMPLHQLDKFIEENKHLPEIPSAKEVEANGISLGEMDAKLLQKIEELTLYTIEQQKVIEELVKQNDDLAKRVKKIERRRK